MATPTEKEQFSAIITRACKLTNITIIEAIMDYCESNSLEVEVAATLLNDELKAKLERQAKKSNLLKPEPKKKRKKK